MQLKIRCGHGIEERVRPAFLCITVQIQIGAHIQLQNCSLTSRLAQRTTGELGSSAEVGHFSSPVLSLKTPQQLSRIWIAFQAAQTYPERSWRLPHAWLALLFKKDPDGKHLCLHLHIMCRNTAWHEVNTKHNMAAELKILYCQANFSLWVQESRMQKLSSPTFKLLGTQAQPCFFWTLGTSLLF